MSDALENGIAAYKNGDRARAGQYLQQALKENPQNIPAWLWLAVLVNEVEQKRYCFQKVLALDPQNENALKGMNSLREGEPKPALIETQEKGLAEQKLAVVPEKPRQRFEYQGSIEASYTPWDVYEPHMPSVDVYSDMDFFFENARVLGQKAARQGFLPEFLKVCPEFEGRIAQTTAEDENEKYITLITPGRMVWLLPAPLPTARNKEMPILDHYLPKHKKHLRITVIGYNKLDAILSLRETEEIVSGKILEAANKCLPLFELLLPYAGILGHSVLIFEGHSSAFEAGVKNSDVLIVDSAMLDFLQEDWGEIAFRTMHPHAKIYIPHREKRHFFPVIPKNTAPGWELGSGIGDESSYGHLILMILGESKLKGKHFLATTGKPLPNLLQITTDPAQQEFISKIPFDYETLDAQRLSDWLLKLSEQKFLSSTRVYKSAFAGKKVQVEFNLKVTKEKNGETQLDLWLK